MDRTELVAGILAVIMMGLMFVLGAASQALYNRHTLHKMGLAVIELENTVEEYKTACKECLDLNYLLIEYNIGSKQQCDEQIEKIAC